MPPFPRLVREITVSTLSGLVDPKSSLWRKLLIVGGLTGSGLRLAAGTSIGRLGPRPEKLLRLWEFEHGAQSRVVRESLSGLDLDAEIRPCPEGGARFRSELQGETVPRLEDPNTNTVLTGGSAIVRHLHTRYGTGSVPWLWAWLFGLAPIAFLTGLGVGLLTAFRGRKVRASRAPAQPLELWSFESSPYCRMVRSVLSELELPYVLHNLAKDSPRRPAFLAAAGRMQFPYLHDPNTGTRMYESLEIEAYLERTYAA